MRHGGTGEWVLPSYRLPREPSTPRIGVWRKLKRLGVAQLSDGLVALPADARTREQLEWIDDEVIEVGGTAGIWLAHPATTAQERRLAASMSAARAAEYAAVSEQAALALASGQDEATRHSAARRLRAELRRIGRRDYFHPPQRRTAHAAVDALIAPGGHRRGDEGAAEMKWSTRAGVHIDRAACAWLIRRHIDPDAEFVFVGDPATGSASVRGPRHG
ncbi:chromate resistance protein ChrB domain-containing protein [Microtetraspora niveoalba]|uniref:chromate resistance protein ChrB domain-containing protein n=1 Tax=Microtetraspora niveoalba TaxID=46175 RepID=UPI0024817955|nr:chromate resistance protein ChrB domain-containing protein [Microtetraspora niveoalba]